MRDAFEAGWREATRAVCEVVRFGDATAIICSRGQRVGTNRDRCPRHPAKAQPQQTTLPM